MSFNMKLENFLDCKPTNKIKARREQHHVVLSRVLTKNCHYKMSKSLSYHIISAGFAMALPILNSEAPYKVKYSLNSTTNR